MYRMEYRMAPDPGLDPGEKTTMILHPVPNGTGCLIPVIYSDDRILIGMRSYFSFGMRSYFSLFVVFILQKWYDFMVWTLLD